LDSGQNKEVAVSSYRTFLDPTVIAKLSSISLKARYIVEGTIAGLHKSPYHGFSVEFSEHREYVEGDEIRHIDWKLYGKSDKYYVKQFEEESNLRCYLLLDSSNSMGYSSDGKMTKLEYGSYVVASLAYLMVKQGDAVGFMTFNEDIADFVPPRSTLSHIKVIHDKLENLKPSKKTNISKALTDLAKNIKRRGLIIVISDLFDDPKRVLDSLKHFRYRKHEVVVLHILDTAELEFPFNDFILFEDMESDLKVMADSKAIRNEYLSRIRAFMDELRDNCRKNRIDYALFDTSTPLDVTLATYLLRRNR
jgi:uncharacterized protein (DUF58 family)